MDGDEFYSAVKGGIVDAMEEGAGGKVTLALPVKPFRAQRELSDGEVDDANVVGIRFDPVAGEWKFVAIVSDGRGELYVTETETVEGELPDLP